jgi:hypothetical protein
MSVKNGTIDKNISGNLINKFGKKLPIPFIESVEIGDESVDVTLTMYYSVSEEELNNVGRFVSSIKSLGFNVYFTLLVEEMNETIANSPGNYNYSKFLQNINKNIKDSHILNYISPWFRAGSEVYYEPATEVTYTSLGHPVSSVCFLYPQEDASSLASSATGILSVTDGFGFSYDSFDQLASSIQTNTYKVPIEEFTPSGVVFSRTGEPIIAISAVRKIGAPSLNNYIQTVKPGTRTDPTQKIMLYNADTDPGTADTQRTFFGVQNYATQGIKKLGLAAFTTLFSGLETNYNLQGIQNAFKSTSSKVNFYKSFASDISHTQIMEMGRVLTSPVTIFEDIAGNLVESVDVIRSISSEFYANDKIKLNDIISGLQELITEAPDSIEAKTLMDSLAFILGEEIGQDSNLLPKLNKFRSQIPNRAITTQEGRFYENLKIKIYNANQAVIQGRKLKRLVIQNPIVRDLRSPLIASTPYIARTDILCERRRTTGYDTSNGSLSRAIEGTRPQDFIPFIYLHGHEIQGQVNLDPRFNPLSVPAAFSIPPYFANTEEGISGLSINYAYGNIVRAIKNYYAYAGLYDYVTDRSEYISELGAGTDFAMNRKFDTLGGFLTAAEGGALSETAADDILSINSYLEQVVGKGVDQAFNELSGESYDIGNYDLDNNSGDQTANNKFTLVENGHFSFDYEKALGLNSNISLALNTQKIDLLFGKDLLQSKFKVNKVRVDVHAKLISDTETALGVLDHLNDETYSTYDSSPVLKPDLEDEKVPHSHLPIGSILAEFDNVSEGNPVATNCRILKPAYLDDLASYRSEIESRMGTVGFAAVDDLGQDTDYRLHKDFVKREILTGYTIGKPTSGGGLPYVSYYSKSVLEDDIWDNTLYNLDIQDRYVSIEKTHSYIALRNIGSIHSNPSGGQMMRQYPMMAAPYTSAVITDRYGKPAGRSLSDGEISIEEFTAIVTNFIANNTLSYVEPALAASAPNYRLMTFEFQKVGIIGEEILETGDLGSGGLANILAFRTGILPKQVEKYIDRQFYEFYVEVKDQTYGVYRFIRDDLRMAKTAFSDYAILCRDNCSFNNLNKTFNDFFIDGIEAEYSEDPSNAPWIRAPLLYCMHLELLNNAFQGDIEKLKEYAMALSHQISPRSGSLRAIETFRVKIRELYERNYGDGAPPGSPQHMIETYKGPTTIDFGKPRSIVIEGTSGYTLMGNRYAYNGYVAEYQKDLHDEFSVSITGTLETIDSDGDGFGDIVATATSTTGDDGPGAVAYYRYSPGG